MDRREHKAIKQQFVEKIRVKFKRNFFVSVCLVLCVSANATDDMKSPNRTWPTKLASSEVDGSDLTGIYRVKGDCAYRTVAGDYNTCVIWNELKLTHTKDAEYAFGLKTHSFSTTQGECGVSGTLQITRTGNRSYLTGSDNTLERCRVRFEVTKTSIILNSPGLEQCTGACGSNAVLESVPFPKKLETGHRAHCDDGHYHSHDFQMKCAKKRYESADQRLNETYHSLINRLTLKPQEKLRAEQRLWLKGLVPNCEQATGAKQGIESIWQGEFHDCLAQESLRRIQELARWKVSRTECNGGGCVFSHRRDTSPRRGEVT